MISVEVFQQIRRLLAEGRLSQRRIALQVGVSRGTVNAIALGKRPDYRRPDRRADQIVAPSGPPRRCPSCGGMVQMPCLACRVTAIKQTGRRSPTDATDRRRRVATRRNEAGLAHRRS